MSFNQKANSFSVSVEDERVRFFRERLHNNSQQFLNDMKVMSNELNHLRVAIHISSFVVLDSSVQTLSLASFLNSQMTVLMQFLLFKNFESRSKKLLDISKYDENEARLNF
jgi:hypothetical protein